jgi:hypothetical protein
MGTLFQPVDSRIERAELSLLRENRLYYNSQRMVVSKYTKRKSQKAGALPSFVLPTGTRNVVPRSVLRVGIARQRSVLGASLQPTAAGSVKEST